MTSLGASEVQQLVEGICAAVLGWEVSAGPAPAGTEEFLTGCIPIAGAWDGAVLLDCHHEPARRAAGVMFGLGAEMAPDPEAVRDALGELTNILGGNLKALLPGPCHLGLPTVVSGRDATSLPGGRPLLQVPFRCQDLPLLARVVVREQPASAGSTARCNP